MHLIKHRLQGNDDTVYIQVINKQAKNLPKINGYHGLINQVFMHLINNAIDSLISAQNQGDDSDWVPTIWITTEQVNPNRVAIRIRDNGVGIAPE